MKELGLSPLWVRRRNSGPAGAIADAPAPAVTDSAPATGIAPSADHAVQIHAMDWAQLKASASTCTACVLHKARKQAVFGVGDEKAEWLFVGEGPGAEEDERGEPFVGQAGKLLDKLLAEIGMQRNDVFVANVLKCRPPGNRNPQPDEIEACESHLFRQIELIEPVVVATLGNFATKLLSGRPLGITRVHGQEQETTIGSRSVLLYPLYHPAAALYTPSMLSILAADFARLPQLLGRSLEQSTPPEPELTLVAAHAASEQLGLF
jgi:uracil-DNA glycosylase family 4